LSQTAPSTVEPATVIQIDARGCATLEITDSEGEVFSYSVALASSGFDTWVVTLTRLDGEGKSPYRVAINPTGSWRCSCDDAHWRARKAKRLCKHARAVKGLYLLTQSLIPKETPPPS
jgi:hypothetical protein